MSEHSEMPPPQPPQEVVPPSETNIRVTKRDEAEMNWAHNALRRIYYDYYAQGRPLTPNGERALARAQPLLPGRRIQIHHADGSIEAARITADVPDDVRARCMEEDAPWDIISSWEFINHQTGAGRTHEERWATRDQGGLGVPLQHHDWLIFLEIEKQASDGTTHTQVERRSLSAMGILDASWLTEDQRREQANTYTEILPQEETSQ